MKKLLDIAALSATLAIIVTALGYAAVYGIDRADRNDCLTWQKEAAQYRLFYLTEEQHQTCVHQNIPVDAPVQKKESVTTPAA